jgi:hypothetical protein
MTVRSESRQEERKDGGQISGVRSERRVRPSLDQEEPARSLKCKIEAVVQLHFGVLAIGVSDTGSWSVETLCNKNAEIAI